MYLFGLRPGKDAFYGRPGFLQIVAFIYLIGGFIATCYYGRIGFIVFTSYVFMGGYRNWCVSWMVDHCKTK